MIVNLHIDLLRMPRVYLAYLFMLDAHKYQTRKFTNEPYSNHCVRVANTVYGVKDSYESVTSTCIAALLHDTIEDTKWNWDDLDILFGNNVSQIVWSLTEDKNSNLNRAKRKELTNLKLKKCNADVKTIKLADRLDNLPSMIHFDPNFAKQYKIETLDMLPCLIGGSPVLWHELDQIARGKLIKNVHETELAY